MKRELLFALLLCLFASSAAQSAEPELRTLFLRYLETGGDDATILDLASHSSDPRVRRVAEKRIVKVRLRSPDQRHLQLLQQLSDGNADKAKTIGDQ